MLRWYEPVWIAFFAGAALKSTAVFALAWVVTKLLQRRSAALRHLVWTAAAVAALALPFLAIGLPELRIPVALPRISFSTTAVDRADGPNPSEVIPGTPATPEPARSAPWMPDWALVAMALWVAGAAAGVGQMALAGVAMARMRRRAQPFPEDFGRLAAELGVSPGVPVLQAKAGTMPMMFGLIRPVVFLPADAAAWTEERRRMVVLHELAHVGRGDTAAHLLARAALCLYWWNPLAWVAWREFLKERERATDDLVLRTGARASNYAEHLLDVARSMQPAESLGWAALGMARHSQLEGRLLAILDARANRGRVGRGTAGLAAVGAVLLVAPFAAMQGQDQNQAAVPADVDATIRAALAQKNHEILDQAAAGFTRLKQYDTAQKLLENSLAVRAETSGQQSVSYGEGLAKLGDLAWARRQKAEAADFYTRAAAAIGNQPEAAHALFSLGLIAMSDKNYSQAEDYFQRMGTADPAQYGRTLLWLANARAQAGDAAQAETYYRQAIATLDEKSAEGPAAMDLLARLLKQQGRVQEADELTAKASSLRQTGSGLGSGVVLRAQAGGGGMGSRLPNFTRVQPQSTPGAVRVGAGITPPVVEFKVEPEYTEEARAAKYQGAVLLYAEVGPDGLAHNVQVIRSLGLGLDQKAIDAISQWRFKPAMKDGVPLTVQATIEVNFRLM